MSSGQSSNVASVRTETLKEQLASFPQASVAVYITVVIPTGKVFPGEKLLVRVIALALLLATATGSAQCAFVKLSTTFKSAGQLCKVSAVMSCTVILCEQVKVSVDILLNVPLHNLVIPFLLQPKSDTASE